MKIKRPKWVKLITWIGLGIIFFIGSLLILFPDEDSNLPKNQTIEITKNQAYYKCLAKTKECYDIPADRLSMQKYCEYLFMNTPDSDSKTLIDFTNGMC